jgi:23S rRNA (adenine2503-C2)-methyltransferase
VAPYNKEVSGARPNLFGLDREAIAGVVASLGEPKYRADQLYSWLYRKRATSIEAMANLPKAFRQAVAERFDLRWPAVSERSQSSDGTVKYLFRLDDGATIESVYIPEERRRTICISTQAGCPIKCTFCLTGISGYKRNLKPWEILGQVAVVMAEAPRPGGVWGGGIPPDSMGAADSLRRAQMAWNVVVMGMGEPLLNYENTIAALRILMDPEGFAVAPKKLTLSTVGILPALEKLAHEPVRPNLAISLHAPNPALRRELVPIEAKYSTADVIAAADRYPIPRGGYVTYEYVLLGGVNDQPQHARDLARLLRGRRGKVNLIPLNAAPDIPYDPPRPEAVDAFTRILMDAGIQVNVRRPRGQDILAACGQLHMKRAPDVPVPAVTVAP